MIRICCAGFVVVLAILSSSCSDDDNPTGPTGNTVVIYADTNFRGNSRAMLGDAPDLDDLPGCGGAGADWDDCISSIHVPAGWEDLLPVPRDELAKAMKSGAKLERAGTARGIRVVLLAAPTKDALTDLIGATKQLEE